MLITWLSSNCSSWWLNIRYGVFDDKEREHMGGKCMQIYVRQLKQQHQLYPKQLKIDQSVLTPTRLRRNKFTHTHNPRDTIIRSSGPENSGARQMMQNQEFALVERMRNVCRPCPCLVLTYTSGRNGNVLGARDF